MRKNRKNELDVDFIGEQGRSLTAEEAKAISDFIKSQKAKAAKRPATKKRTIKRKKTLA
ncbi:MAG: hypothetical protein K0Q79_211 [Flavipsychrobacter sp.]|jgi:hypothetical protein|nr:hypothetical protein [Flavipsychrobacter sp.]